MCAATTALAASFFPPPFPRHQQLAWHGHSCPRRPQPPGRTRRWPAAEARRSHRTYSSWRGHRNPSPSGTRRGLGRARRLRGRLVGGARPEGQLALSAAGGVVGCRGRPRPSTAATTPGNVEGQLRRTQPQQEMRLPPPRRLHVAPRRCNQPSRRLHAASTPPHAASTPPHAAAISLHAASTSPHAASTPPSRRLYAAPTPPQRCRNVAPTPLHSAAALPPRSGQAASTPPPRHCTQQQSTPTPRPQPPYRPNTAFAPPPRRRDATSRSHRNAAPAQLHSATQRLSTPRRHRPHAA